MVAHKTGEELCEYISGLTGGVCMLSFSGGKDGVGAWLQIRPYFKTIVPVYMYHIPNMAFVEGTLAYYEDYFGQRIVRMPSPALYRWLNNATFQDPANLQTVRRLGFGNVKTDDIFHAVAENLWGKRQTAWTAVGIRASDNLARRAAASKFGGLIRSRRVFWPIWDWSVHRLSDKLASHGIRLSIDYQVWGRSFDGIQYAFLAGMKHHFPDDYARILELFPLAELEFARRKFIGQEYAFDDTHAIDDGDVAPDSETDVDDAIA